MNFVEFLSCWMLTHLTLNKEQNLLPEDCRMTPLIYFFLLYFPVNQEEIQEDTNQAGK